MSRATPLPSRLAGRSIRIVRPRDAADIYSNPSGEFQRLVEAELLVKVARGYYAIPPRGAARQGEWRPTPEAVALGIAIVDYGREHVSLCGVSAARLLGALPRAIAAGVVSVPARRPGLRTTVGLVEFWHRDPADVDVHKARTDLATGWSTTPPQTLLDLADRPGLGNVDPGTFSEVIWHLAQSVDWKEVHRISEIGKRRAAYSRALWVCAGIAGGAAPPPHRGRTVSTKGLRSWSDADPAPYGIADD